MLGALRGKLVASCQPVPGGPIDQPDIVAAMAQAGRGDGAAGLRIECAANLRVVRRVTRAAIIGLVKRSLSQSRLRITPFREDGKELVAEGAVIVAVGATRRALPRFCPRPPLCDTCSWGSAMADCSTAVDGTDAAESAVDLLGSRLSGSTGQGDPGLEPDLALVASLAANGRPTLAEDRNHRQNQAADAIRASAVVVGSAITRVEHVTGWFAEAMAGAGHAG